MELDPFVFLSYAIGRLRDLQHTNLDNDRKMFGPPHDDLCFAFLLHNDCPLPITSLYIPPPIFARPVSTLWAVQKVLNSALKQRPTPHTAFGEPASRQCRNNRALSLG